VTRLWLSRLPGWASLAAYCLTSGLAGTALGIAVMPLDGYPAAMAAWAGSCIIAGLARR
jgi:hypothetical protein